MSGTSRYDIDIVANNKASRALGKVTKQLGNIESKAVKANSTFRKMGTAAAAAATALGGMKLATGFLNTAKQFEELGIQLKYITGNAKDGAKALDIVETAAGNAAFSMEEMAAAAPSLLTVSSVDQLADTLSMAGDIAAATGMTFQESASQLQRAFGGGIAAADIFREKGVKSMLGFQEGVKYTAAQTEMMIRKAFENGTTSVKGASAEMAKTWTGQVSMMGDKWMQFKKTTMESGLFPELKKQLGDLDKFMSDNAEAINDMAVALGENLARGIIALGDGVKFIAEHSDKFKTAAEIIIKLTLASWALKAANAFRVMATGIMTVMAMSGPAGWAALAGGIAALTVGTLALNKAFGETAPSMDADTLAKEIATIEEKLTSLKDKNKELEKSMVDMGAPYQDFTVDLNDLNDGFSSLEDRVIEIPNLYEGATAAMASNSAEIFLLEKQLEALKNTTVLTTEVIEEQTAATHPLAEGYMSLGQSLHGVANEATKTGKAFELMDIKNIKFYPDAVFRMAEAEKANAKAIDNKVMAMKDLFSQLNPVQSITDRYNESIKTLNFLIKNNIGDSKKWKILLGQIKNEIAALVEPLDTQASRFANFFDELVTNSKAGAEQLVFVEMAASKAQEMLNAGLISIDAYAQMMVNLGKGTSEAAKETEKFSDFFETLSAQLFPTETQVKIITEQIGKLTAEITKNGDETGQLGKAIDLLKEKMRLLDPEVQKQIEANKLLVASMTGYKDAVMRAAEAKEREKLAIDNLVTANNKLYAATHPVETQMALLQTQIDGVNKQLELGIGNTEKLESTLVELKKEMRDIDPALAAQRELVESLQGYDDAILRHKRIVEANNAAKGKAMLAEAEFKEEMRGLLDTLFPAQAALTAHQQQILDIEKAYKLGEYTLTEYNEAIAKSNELFKESQDDGFGAELQAVTENLKPLNKIMRENEEVLATLKRGLDENILSTKEYNDLVGIQAEKFAEATKTMKTASEEFVEGFNKDFNDTFADALVEGNLSFDTFADLWKGTLKSLISDTLNQGTLLNDILGGFGKGAGGGGFNFGSLFSGGGADGIGNFGMVGDFFGGIGSAFGLYADGGKIKAGETGIVGEAGAELVSGPATVTSNQDSFGGNAPPVNITIQAIDTQTGTEFLLKNKRQIEGIVQSAYNRRGKQGIY